MIIKDIKEELDKINSIDDKIKYLNELKSEINNLSPLDEPVDNVQWVSMDKVFANEYNPNKVATPEMKLLYKSIKLDGYTQPIVAYKINDDRYEIVDGFHRNRVGREFQDIKDRVNGYLPLVVIEKSLDERMGSTIRHNRARGSHQIQSMSDIVLKLSKEEWTDNEICEKLGMEIEEVIRLKQISGLKEAFANHKFSKSWDEFESKNFPDQVGKMYKTVSKKPTRKEK